MLETMYAAPASPRGIQVDRHVQMLVRISEGKERAMIIVNRACLTSRPETCQEGCLSVPGSLPTSSAPNASGWRQDIEARRSIRGGWLLAV